MLSKTITGPTPNGGVASTIYYRDDNGDPVDESVATNAEIVEVDVAGKVIYRTYGMINRGTPAPEQPKKHRRS
jgi:hypothetical protein